MDANKLKRLNQVGYTFYPTCGRCVHANMSAQVEWGTCKRHLYFHEKHKETMEMSINKNGGCIFFKDKKIWDIEKFKGALE